VSRQLDEDGLVQVYRDTIRPLYAFVSRRVGGDAGLAEDLVQETWMRALGAWPADGVPDEPLAWLQRVARNTLVSHFRRVRPEPTDPVVLDLAASPIADEPDAAALVTWGLAQLRRTHADVLESFYFDDKSVREIADEQQTSERAIEGRLRRAREKLRKKLQNVLKPVAKRGGVISERTDHA
jgi:RNA polymerase sigma-70 factor (ECF subfamily)